MKLTIFSRMVTSLLAIFILSMAASIFSILQLRHLEDITKSIIRVDAHSAILEQELSNTFLSMIRYEKKFMIMKDEGLYDQFLLIRADFEKYLSEVALAVRTADAKDLVAKVNQNYASYLASLNEEVNYLRSGTEYDGEGFQRARDKAAEAVMENLKKLGTYSRDTALGKVKQLGDVEDRARKVAISITITSLIVIIAISIILTVNITRPLSLMKKKTREIARGDFGEDLELLSPPEIRELAQSFNAMCRRLKEIDRMKTDFFSLMSHELRTPLTSIKEGTLLLIESFKKADITENQKKLLTIMSEESARLIKLVNALLDLSKMEAGMMSYNFTRSDIMALITMAVREIEPLAETKNIKVEIKAGNGFLPIRADNERLLQVLRNLIGNAVKFTPRNGFVSVCARAIEDGVQVSVQDTGTGIARESLDTIFEKFQQDPSGHSDKIKGTGLGLSIVKHIIESHGGKVWAESTVGQGSTFTFVLPV